jgi:hypothetical protein
MILAGVPAKSREYWNVYFFRGPPGFVGQLFITGRGRW